MESARPGAGRHLDTKVAENGSSVIAANGSVLAPFTSTSSRERIRVSLKKSPWAAPAAMSPELPLMAKVDSSTRVTTLALGIESGDRTGKVPRVGHAVTVPVDLVTCAIPGPLPARSRFLLYP